MTTGPPPELDDLKARLGAPTRSADAPGRLLRVPPARDALPVTKALAARLAEPAEVVTVPDDWRAG
jgi:hypothetical protein